MSPDIAMDSLARAWLARVDHIVWLLAEVHIGQWHDIGRSIERHGDRRGPFAERLPESA